MKKAPPNKTPKVSFSMPLPTDEAGNAYAIMGLFQQACKKAKWPQSAINTVLDEAMSKDYAHLRKTIHRHIK